MASYIVMLGRNVCGIWQRLVLIPEDPDPAYTEEAEDEPQTIGQATIMYAADQKTLEQASSTLK